MQNKTAGSEENTDPEMYFLTISAFLPAIYAALTLSDKRKDIAMYLSRRENMSKIIELSSTTNWFDQIPSKFLKVTSQSL